MGVVDSGGGGGGGGGDSTAHLYYVLRDPKCKAELDGWNLVFDDKLVRFGARVLPPEKIFQKDSEVREVSSQSYEIVRGWVILKFSAYYC